MNRPSLLIFLLTAVAFSGCGKDGATGPTGPNLSVYDTSNVKVGTVAFADWPNIGVEFPDNAIGQFGDDGLYVGGLCENQSCTPVSTAGGLTVTSGGGVVSFLSGKAVVRTTAATYCGHTTSDCSGNCYVQDKPAANSLFLDSTGFFQSTGSETVVTGITLRTVYVHDLGSCSATTTPGGTLGVCCTLSGGGGVSANGYPVSNSYSKFPAGVPSYPFSGPLRVAP